MKETRKEKKTADEKTEHTALSSRSEKQGTTPREETAQETVKKSYGGLWLALIGAAVLLTILVLALTVPRKSSDLLHSDLSGETQMRYGTDAEFQVLFDGAAEFQEKDEIVWKVNGMEMFRGKAEDPSSRVFSFHPEKTGEFAVSAEFPQYPNWNVKKIVTVLKPLLKVEVTSLSKRYGDENPKWEAAYQGFVDGDTQESLGLDPVFSSDAERYSDVGVYYVEATGLESDKYDVEITKGTLTILPRTLSISFTETEKVYDGTADLDAELRFETVNGDEITAEYDSLAFENASAGKRRILLEGLKLTGAKANNYLADVSGSYGTILPRELKLTGLKVNDKIYDGNTSVSFSAAGTLEGVLKQDKVGVGSIKARFENAASGKGKKVLIDSVELIGQNSENYTVTLPTDVTGNIKGNNKFLDFTPSVPGTKD